MQLCLQSKRREPPRVCPPSQAGEGPPTVPRAAQRPQEFGQWPPCLGPARASPSLLYASVPSPVSWDCWQERTFIYYRQACAVPGMAPGLQGALSAGHLRPGETRLEGRHRSGLSCLISPHPAPSLGHGGHALSVGTRPDQAQGPCSRPPPLGSEMRG